MHILLTGATGNLGQNTLPELLRQGHRVRCFVRRPGVLKKIARHSAGSIEPVEGDIRQLAHLAKAVQDVDTIIHLAFMIPPASEDHPELARSINIDGTRNLLEAASRQSVRPRILFSSSFDVLDTRSTCRRRAA